MSDESIIDWERFSLARAELGADFIRILGYFREDGVKSVSAVETAMRARNAVALVNPAHMLKGEARQFGGSALAELAERIEDVARHCVECREAPDEALPDVVKLRELFAATMENFDREVNPLVERRRFVRTSLVTNQQFGRF